MDRVPAEAFISVTWMSHSLFPAPDEQGLGVVSLSNVNQPKKY